MHKYILHGLGKKQHSFWAYHLREHHAVCLLNNMLDPGYRNIRLGNFNTQSKELLVLSGIILCHSPLYWLSPAFALAVIGSLLLYYYKHRKAHLDPAWALKHLRWHYEHHLAGHSNVNWCVTWPWFDYVMRTRVVDKTLD